MSTLQQQIAEKFLSKLAESDNMDAAKIEKLRALLSDNKKAKAEDFIKIFTAPAGEDLK
jgi:predicted transcriptional regulator